MKEWKKKRTKGTKARDRVCACVAVYVFNGSTLCVKCCDCMCVCMHRFACMTSKQTTKYPCYAWLYLCWCLLSILSRSFSFSFYFNSIHLWRSRIDNNFTNVISFQTAPIDFSNEIETSLSDIFYMIALWPRGTKTYQMCACLRGHFYFENRMFVYLIKST